MDCLENLDSNIFIHSNVSTFCWEHPLARWAPSVTHDQIKQFFVNVKIGTVKHDI